MRQLQVFVVTFNAHKGEPVAVGHAPATTPEAGICKAEKLLGRYYGVGVYGIWYDAGSGDASDLHEIARYGCVPSLDVMETAA